MIKHITILLLIVFTSTIKAQSCFSGAQATLIARNEVGAYVTNSGTNLTSYSSPGFSVPYSFAPVEPRKYTIGASSIWIGGKDASGTLKVAASSYPERAGIGDYVSGPIPATGNITEAFCSQWDNIWVVYSNDIINHIAVFKSQGFNTNPDESLLKWPGKGNPHFKKLNGFDLPDRAEGYAPFYDANSDGIYNPVNGDYPALSTNGCFIPDIMAWCVFNDVGGQHIHSKSIKPVNVEIQQLVWEIASNDSILNRSLFSSYKILYKGKEDLDSVYVGLWTDFDLGCTDDDFHGCNIASNTYYGYNANKDKDVSCSYGTGYGDNPPVQAVTMLNKTLDKYTYYFVGNPTNYPVGTHDPKSPEQFYNYMTGKWKDGTTFKKEGYGYNSTGGTTTDFAFPDAPTNTDGWSMVTANMPKRYTNNAVVGSTNLGKLKPEQIINFDVAYTYHRKGGLDGWQNVSQMKTDIANIKSLYDRGFANYQKCIKVATNDLVLSKLKIYPNPTTGLVSIESPKDLIKNISVFDLVGKLVFSKSNFENNHSTNLDLTDLPKGLYLIVSTLEDSVEIMKINITN